ncbi:MAG TPA: class I SAM-dependent methyltransferase [Ktedonobacterales bacterium]|jgi:SAM-dependent methyltransferase|nr:class I SAM-dependent methyltransferase [Ktedonobacterales bacterium]
MAEQADVTRASYNRVAREYAARFDAELAHKPIERSLLDAFATDTTGLICDLGCGPGHVAAYLHARGAEVVGVDLSDAMVEQARRLHPEIRFVRADMRALPFDDVSLGGIIGFYSLIHINPDEMAATLLELRRVVKPGGALLAGFHVGEETRHLDTWWDQPVNLDFHFFTLDAMRAWLTAAGWELQDIMAREPYPEIEVQTQRAYMLACAMRPD